MSARGHSILLPMGEDPSDLTPGQRFASDLLALLAERGGAPAHEAALSYGASVARRARELLEGLPDADHYVREISTLAIGLWACAQAAEAIRGRPGVAQDLESLRGAYAECLNNLKAIGHAIDLESANDSLAGPYVRRLIKEIRSETKLPD
jgi:hypothetical protein